MAAVRRIILLCRSIARAHLCMKLKGRSESERLFGLSLNDLAMDCIAGLFQCNDNGVLVQVQSYFASVDIDRASEQALLAYLRRLVVSKVNIHIIELRSNIDPSFWKILRNVKLAVETIGAYTLVQRLGEMYMVPSTADPLEHLIPMDQQEIENVLQSVAQGSPNIPTLLSKLSRYLQDQCVNARMLPLHAVVSAIRAIYESRNDFPDVVAEQREVNTSEEVACIINIECQKVFQKMKSKYVDRKGIGEQVFVQYFHVVREHLVHKYISEDGQELSLFERFRQHLPQLNKEEYIRLHRARLEYLLNQVENRARKELQVQFGSAKRY